MTFSLEILINAEGDDLNLNSNLTSVDGTFSGNLPKMTLLTTSVFCLQVKMVFKMVTSAICMQKVYKL